MKFVNPLSNFFDGKKRRMSEMTAASEAMKTSAKNLAFVTRFNEETFFKSADLSLFGGSPLSLTEKRDMTAFASLYAIAFYGLTFKDIYTVEEVFGFSEAGIRSKDEQKRQAANDLLHKLKEREPLDSVLRKTAQTLTDMPFPVLDVKNPVFTAENYVNYRETASVGFSFLKAAEAFSDKSEELYLKAVKKAEIFSDYRFAASLCEEIPAIDDRRGYRIKAAKSFKAAEKLQQRVKEEESA